MSHKCDKLLDDDTRQCNQPAILFYRSSLAMICCRCEAHRVIGYKPELGSLHELTENEYEAALVMES